jgi:hypothetical protein
VRPRRERDRPGHLVLSPQTLKVVYFRQIDLLGESIPVQRHERVMPRVERTAQGVLDDHHAKPKIHGAQDAGEHADIRLRT